MRKRTFRILNYEEQEKLKESRSSKDMALAMYHRFLEGTFDHESVPRSECYFVEGFHPTFEEYQQWLKQYPGWGQGSISPLLKPRIWKSEYANQHLPMNEIERRKVVLEGEMLTVVNR